ncbi:hypothetical protein [Kriegella aquimaris]|uniref:DUF4296 domain-containing protein n=1 Tax=Kriegella aquimaris TaxID=192904 RepID=A0A1G9UX23_9FLAO|nr:hypothetical protein [Kriegella aquimaris]SDM64347.1 hypothetical protein SAMN04488514_11210 [Kriegella aquimaris]
MKLSSTLLTFCLSISFLACTGQTNLENQNTRLEVENAKSDATKSINLMDEQVKILNQVFKIGGARNENPLGGATNYQEFLDQLEGSKELKEQAQKIYDVYNTSLDPNKKNELRLKVNKMLEGAMAKSQRDQ